MDGEIISQIVAYDIALRVYAERARVDCVREIKRGPMIVISQKSMVATIRRLIEADDLSRRADTGG
jgi:hypothetical protein